ncbi:MAG: 3-hydroxyacyl-CoA dehydrogenase [Bermanella sp.]|jgi:3-hydroxyacyl-CoA dehydrogenase
MKSNEIKQVCFVGAGTMGCFNALLAGGAGYHCRIFDVSVEACLSTVDRLEQMRPQLVGAGLLSQSESDAAMANIRLCDQLDEALAGVQLVSESVSERLEIKRSVHADLDARCPPDVLITTNTSGLVPSDIDDAFVHGHRFAALHSHLGSKLFDIVRGPRTDEVVIERLQDYVVSLKAIPHVLKKESSGYVLNSILGSVLTAALVTHIDGAPIEAVDAYWISHLGAPIGPFGLMDLFGLDVVYDSWAKVQDLDLEFHREKVVPLLKQYVGDGDLGIKTGQGFYGYPADANAKQPSQNDYPSEQQQLLIAFLILKGAYIASQGVSEPKDIDHAWQVALGTTQTPFSLLEQWGVEPFLESLANSALAAFFPEAYLREVSEYLSGRYLNLS